MLIHSRLSDNFRYHKKKSDDICANNTEIKSLFSILLHLLRKNKGDDFV